MTRAGSTEAPATPTVSGPGDCLNCQTPLVGAYCHVCGQASGPPVPALRDLLHEVYEEFFKLDARIPVTLRLLLKQPGELTRHYMAGRRASVVAPFKLYFGTSFLFFLLMELSSSLTPDQYGFTSDSNPIMVTSRDAMKFWLDHFATISIVLLPIGALTQALLFRRSGQPFIFHLVATLHTLSAGYLLYLPILPLTYLVLLPFQIKMVTTAASFVYLAVFIVYQTAALRNIYRGGWAGSFVKSLLINATSMVIHGLCAVVILACFFYRDRDKLAHSSPSPVKVERR